MCCRSVNKIISAAYAASVFVALLTGTYLCFLSMMPHLYMLQVFTTACWCGGVGAGDFLLYIKASMVVFFVSMEQIVNITFCSFLCDFTPIMWDTNDMDWLTPGIHVSLNLIQSRAAGYRDAFLDKVSSGKRRVDLIFLGGDTAYCAGRTPL